MDERRVDTDELYFIERLKLRNEL